MKDYHRVKELFDYDPETGMLTWKIKKARMNSGDRAGHDHSARGHRVVEFDGKKYKEHRVIWLWYYGGWPVSDIDHINRVKSDNRIANLRLAERGQADNMQNIGVSRRNKSGVLGVCYSPQNARNKWRAYIRLAGKTKMLGSFPTLEEAAAARLDAEKQHYTFKHPKQPPREEPR